MSHQKILIVEDEVIIAMCLELALKKEGYEICQRVGTGEHALLAVRENHPDCIIMDIRLAGNIDGIEASKNIQSSFNIPIIFITGFPDKEIEQKAKKLNPLGYFIKPVKVSTLKQLIDSI